MTDGALGEKQTLDEAKPRIRRPSTSIFLFRPFRFKLKLPLHLAKSPGPNAVLGLIDTQRITSSETHWVEIHCA